jgi:hypothetical protein
MIGSWLAQGQIGAEKISGQDQRMISLPTQEHRMFDISSWTVAQTGSPHRASSIQHAHEVLLLLQEW